MLWIAGKAVHSLHHAVNRASLVVIRRAAADMDDTKKHVLHWRPEESPGASMARYIRTVSPELLTKANLKAVADREKYGSADVIVSIVTSLGNKYAADELIAVSYRLQALAKLLHEGDGQEWTINVAGKEHKLVNEALFRAAAKAPLRERKTVGEVAFKIQEFLQIALQEADSEGSA